MNNTLFIAAIAGILLVTGCQSTPEPVGPPPSDVMDASSIDALRAGFKAENANVTVERVARILPNDDYLALDGANSADFPVGMTRLTIIDSNKNVLGFGEVVAIVGSEVHVRFTTTGPRRPQVGDAVLKF